MSSISLLITKILCTILLLGVWGVYVGFFFTQSIFLSNIAFNLIFYSIFLIIAMYKPLLWVGGYRVKPLTFYALWIVGLLLSFTLVNTVKEVWGAGIMIMYLLIIITPWIFPRELKHILEDDPKKDSVKNIFWVIVGYFAVSFAIEPVENVFELSSLVPVFVGFGIGLFIRFSYLRLCRSKD